MRPVLIILVGLCAACAARSASPPSPSPVAMSLSVVAGCDREDLTYDWHAARYGLVSVGENVCSALGKWGQPTSLTTMSSDVGESLVMQWIRGSGPSLTISASKKASKFARLGPTTYFRVETVTTH